MARAHSFRLVSIAIAGGVVSIVALFAAIFHGPHPARAQPIAIKPPELYLRDCAFCHGNEGAGTNRGPSLVGVGAASADFYLSTGRMPVEREVQVATRGPIQYNDDEIDFLVDYVASLDGGPSIPTVDDGDLQQGGHLYTENCAACHGSAGAGAALTSGLVAPDLYQSSRVEIAEAIRIGPGTMPLFGPETFDDDEVNAIVAYTDYIQEPDDRGGASLGHVGPVTEGMVGWILGLGVLVVVLRWIGTRADD